MIKAVLISRVDREDLWVCDGLAIALPETRWSDTYEEAITHILSVEGNKDKIVKHILDECTLTDLFNEEYDSGDDEADEVQPKYTVTFAGYRSYGFVVEITTEDEQTFEIYRQLDSIDIL